MSDHFEDIWNQSEALVAKEVVNKPLHSIIMEADNLLGLYEAIDTNEKLPAEEKPTMKTQLFGKLLMVLAQLSAKDNINVYAGMQQVLNEDRIALFQSQYQQ